ncbi:MAG: LemA protein [Marinobacter sp. T13-3]|nr:MAG: LemA protein [Marinobacter sp. T13-3]
MELNTIIALVGLALVVMFVITTYNGIVNAKNAVKRAWASVLTQERQKNKILPDLQDAVSRYSEFEQSVQTQITELRSEVSKLKDSTPDVERLQTVEALSGKVLKGLQVTMEAYPDLKASDLFQKLMREITEQQEQIGAAIRIYNHNVEAFNNQIQNFPNNVVNSLLNREKEVETFTDTGASEGFEYQPNI